MPRLEKLRFQMRRWVTVASGHCILFSSTSDPFLFSDNGGLQGCSIRPEFMLKWAISNGQFQNLGTFTHPSEVSHLFKGRRTKSRHFSYRTWWRMEYATSRRRVQGYVQSTKFIVCLFFPGTVLPDLAFWLLLPKFQYLWLPNYVRI